MSGVRCRKRVVFFILLMTAACGSSPAPNRSVPHYSLGTQSGGTSLRGDNRPIRDHAPYWCDLVPKEALARASGSSHDLAEIRAPTNSADQAICGVRDGQPSGPLGVTWDLRNGRTLMATGRRQVAADHPQPLPTELGTGYSAYSPRTAKLPYAAEALFRCGAHEPWIFLALRSIAPGRNATEDLIALMRIAERRFGVLHHCTPAAASG